MTDAYKDKESGEIVIPTPGSDYHKRLQDSESHEHLNYEELVSSQKKARTDAAKAQETEREEAAKVAESTSGATKPTKKQG